MRKNNRKTMNIICENWLEYIHLHVKYSTYVQYERIVHTHICRYFNNIKMSEVTFPELQNFIHHLSTKGNQKNGRGLSAKTINDILIVLKSIFQYYNITESNGAELPPIQRLRVQQKPVKVFNKEDYQTLEDYLTQNTSLSKLGILVSMYTGLRIGEVCALQWKNIDFEKELLCITQTVYRTKNPMYNPDGGFKTKVIISAPKTWNSMRQIPMCSKLVNILNEFHPYYNKESFVLTGTNVPMDPRTYQYQYKKHLQSCNIPYLNFHCLRHTFSTRCIEMGCDIKSLSEMLGHSSTNVTLQRYVFSSYEQKKQFVDLL